MSVGIAGMGHVTTEPDTAGGDVCKAGLPLYVLNVSLQIFFFNFYYLFCLYCNDFVLNIMLRLTECSLMYKELNLLGYNIVRPTLLMQIDKNVYRVSCYPYYLFFQRLTFILVIK